MTITDTELNRANAERKRKGKRPLTRHEAERATSTSSAIDLNTLLIGYTLYESMPSHTHSYSSEPSTFSGGGGDFGGGGASGSWDSGSSYSDSSSSSSSFSDSSSSF